MRSTKYTSNVQLKHTLNSTARIVVVVAVVAILSFSWPLSWPFWRERHSRRDIGCCSTTDVWCFLRSTSYILPPVLNYCNVLLRSAKYEVRKILLVLMFTSKTLKVKVFFVLAVAVAIVIVPVMSILRREVQQTGYRVLLGDWCTSYIIYLEVYTSITPSIELLTVCATVLLYCEVLSTNAVHF